MGVPIGARAADLVNDEWMFRETTAKLLRSEEFS